jgi:hypothetical protein
MIRFGVSNLIDLVKKEQNFELEDYEKNTLFKNAAKLLSNYGENAWPALKELGELSRLCKVNIFTYKDKKERGIDWRLIQTWSKEIKNNDIIKVFRPHDDPSNSNILSKIFEESMRTGSIYRMFETPWQ